MWNKTIDNVITSKIFKRATSYLWVYYKTEEEFIVGYIMIFERMNAIEKLKYSFKRNVNTKSFGRGEEYRFDQSHMRSRDDNIRTVKLFDWNVKRNERVRNTKHNLRYLNGTREKVCE